jgi:hypothetical protein
MENFNDTIENQCLNQLRHRVPPTIVSIRFNFSVTLGLVSFYTNVEFFAEFLTKALAGLPLFFLCF